MPDLAHDFVRALPGFFNAEKLNITMWNHQTVPCVLAFLCNVSITKSSYLLTESEFRDASSVCTHANSNVPLSREKCLYPPWNPLKVNLQTSLRWTKHCSKFLLWKTVNSNVIRNLEREHATTQAWLCNTQRTGPGKSWSAALVQ